MPGLMDRFVLSSDFPVARVSRHGFDVGHFPRRYCFYAEEYRATKCDEAARHGKTSIQITKITHINSFEPVPLNDQLG